VLEFKAEDDQIKTLLPMDTAAFEAFRKTLNDIKPVMAKGGF
jgi:hypothetical protein